MITMSDPDRMKHLAVARGACPICLRTIGLEKINLVTRFPCPCCSCPLSVSHTYRALLYVACYGIPTLAIYHSIEPVAVRIIEWIAYAFICGFAFIFIGKRICLPRLHVARNDKSNDDIQTLGLGK
jgi:hypothetical protein